MLIDFQRLIGKQFRRPSGLCGMIVSKIMKKGNLCEYEKLLPKLEIKDDDRILEIGFGHGLGLNMICSGHDCFVKGIDFSRLMLNESASRNKKHIKNNKLILDYGDYLQHEYPPESFDKIYFINVIYFWSDLEKPFKKIFYELKHPGRVCLFMARHDHLNDYKFTKEDIFNKYSIEYVCEELTKAGFKNITYTTDNGYYISCEK